MGAREDLREAARRLTGQGRSPFSPAELIAEARRLGSSYPDTTLRTFIVGPMCVNSPDHHAVQYGDLVRVRRGLYRLAGATPDEPTAVTRAPSVVETRIMEAAQPLEPDAWFSERNVKAAVVRHLAGERWHIRRVADTASRERGVDVEADRDGVRMLVEVKGYPASTYARGDRAGQPKSTPAPLQARAYFSHALLSGVLMRNDDAEARVVLTFPEMDTYRHLGERAEGPLSQAGIEIWLVDESGSLRQVG